MANELDKEQIEVDDEQIDEPVEDMTEEEPEMTDREKVLTAMDETGSKYFAVLPVDEIGEMLVGKVKDYYDYLSQAGRMALYLRSYYAYYAAYFSSGDTVISGDNEEYVNMTANHYRNILKHIITMTTSNRIAFDPKAINSDYKSMSQTILAKNLLDYYSRNSMLEQVLLDAVEYSVVYGDAHVLTDWDADTMTDFKEQGDVVFRAYSPLDCIRDCSTKTLENSWHILRERVNKYDLAAKYPAFAKDIIDTVDDGVENLASTELNQISVDMDDDTIYVYTFYHKRTAVVPEGRKTVFINSGVCVYDDDLAQSEYPITAMNESKQHDESFGYTIGFDLLQLQKVINGLYSTILTNQNAFGVQNVLVDKGSNINIEDQAGGLRVIEYDTNTAPPQPLNLLSTPPEVYQFLGKLEQLFETLSGVNSVTRGNPESSLKSGSALALVQSMAIQFISSLQNSYAKTAEKVATRLVSLLRDFSNSTRVVMISGKNNRSYVKEFTGEDLSSITLVSVDLGNALSKTVSGRTEIAKDLLQSGLIKDAQSYLQVIETGNLEPMIEGEISEQMLIRSENEALFEKQYVQAVSTDLHTRHIQWHKSVLSSLDARKDPEIIQRTLGHIAEHIQLLKTTDPDILTFIGEPVLAPPPPPPMADGSGVMQPPMAGEANLPNMPNMPKNPMTGQEFENTTGGLQ